MNKFLKEEILAISARNRAVHAEQRRLIERNTTLGAAVLVALTLGLTLLLVLVLTELAAAVLE